MASGAKKETQKENLLFNQQQAALQQAQAPDPYETRVKQGYMDVLDWNEGKGAFAKSPRDVSQMPGISPYLDIYKRATTTDRANRIGTGALRLGDKSGKGYANKLNQQLNMQAQEEAAGSLQNAVNLNLAEAKGSALPFAQLAAQRNSNILGATTGMYGTYQNRPRQAPLWERIFGMAAMGAGAAGAMGGTGGIKALF